MLHLGIDFGTWYTSAILYRGEDLPYTVVQDPGFQGASIPSCLFYTANRDWLFGNAAWSSRRRYPDRFLHSELKTGLLAHGGVEPHQIGGDNLKLEALIGLLLGWIKQEADRMAGAWGETALETATLTVPVEYGPARRELMTAAAKLAGFKQVNLLDEPVAAALSVLKSGRIRVGETVLIYDLGGGTFDAALVRHSGSQFQVLAKDGLTQCGGVYFDHALYRWLSGQVSQHQPDLLPLLNPRNADTPAQRLRVAVHENCRDAKHQLSNRPHWDIEVPAGDYPSYPIARADFEALVAEPLQQTLSVCRNVLAQAQLSPQDLDHIVMVGGSTRIPAVATLLKQTFGKDPVLAAEPELAIAEGAALSQARQAHTGLPPVQSIHGWPANKVQALQKQTAEALGKPVAFRDALKAGGEGPEMLVIPAGRFLMGSPNDEPERSDDEMQHEVTFAQPYAIGRHAVTFDDYDRYCQAAGKTKPGDQGWGRGRRPVINVSWHDAKAYCAWLSEQTGRRYRLPSEAEWEYACRAGTATPFHWGERITPQQANYNGNYVYNGGAKGEYRQKTVPVGQFTANAFGLYDCHGNVWEWCEDHWHGSYQGAPGDGSAWIESNNNASNARVVRGGSWYSYPLWLRSAYRSTSGATFCNYYLGFRLAQDLSL